MKLLWAYFRRKTMEALIAGAHDALVFGSGSSPLSDEDAARALRALVNDADLSTETPTSPPMLDGPDSNDNSGLIGPVKRGPGRPRKFQEPPQ